MSAIDFSTTPPTQYLAINDYRTKTMAVSSGAPILGVSYTWVKIDHKNKKIHEYTENELPKWIKVLIIVRNFFLAMITFPVIIYNVYLTKEFESDKSPQQKILNDYINTKMVYKTSKKYPLAEIQPAKSEILPQELLRNLPQELLKRIFIEAAQDDMKRCNWSLVSRDFYQMSNSLDVWNSIANKIGLNFSNGPENFWCERATYVNCHKKMESNFLTLTNLFKDPELVLKLPLHWSRMDLKTDIHFNKFKILKKKGLLPLMKKERIIRMINKNNGESSLLFKCTPHGIANSKRELWMTFSLNNHSSNNPLFEYWMVLVDHQAKNTKSYCGISADNFVNQLAMMQALLNGNTLSLIEVIQNGRFQLSLAKET